MVIWERLLFRWLRRSSFYRRTCESEKNSALGRPCSLLLTTGLVPFFSRHYCVGSMKCSMSWSRALQCDFILICWLGDKFHIVVKNFVYMELYMLAVPKVTLKVQVKDVMRILTT